MENKTIASVFWLLLAIFCVAVLIVLAVVNSQAQTTVALTPEPRLQFNYASTGAPLSLGCVFTYAAGTSTPLATYTDGTGTTTNSNPVLLDAAGMPTASGGSSGIWLGPQKYKFAIWSAGGTNCALGSQQYVMDNVSGPNLPLVGSIGFTAQTAPSCSAGQYWLWADSSASRMKMCNNGTIDYVVGQNTTDTLTNKTLNVLAMNSVVYADQQTGATADLKIQACYNAVNSAGGGTCDARGILGSQTWANTVTCYSNTKLLLAPWNAVTFNVPGTINNNWAILCGNVNNVVVNGGNFQLTGGRTTIGGFGAVAINGTSSHIELSDIHVSGDSTLPGNTRFSLTSIQLASNVLTVSYTGSPSPALVVGQMVSIIGVTGDPTLNVELPIASTGAGTFTMAYTHANSGPFAGQGTWSTQPRFSASAIQRTSNVVTVTCTLAASCNALTAGQNVIVECAEGTNCGSLDSAMLGYQIVVTAGSGTFTYSSTGSNAGPFSNSVFTTQNNQIGLDLTGTITDGKLLRNYFQNLVLASACGSSGSDNINGCLVDGNHYFNIVGTTSGTGYGILGQTSSFGGYRIVNNFFECVQRHDVYTGAGAGHVIANNYIARHGCDAPAGGEAFEIGRQADSAIIGNNFSFSYNTPILVFSGATPGTAGQVLTRNVTIIGNTFNNTYPANYATSGSIHDIALSAENNTVDVPHDISIIGNVSRRSTVGAGSEFVSVGYGIRINIQDNDCSYDSVGNNGGCVAIGGSGETAGTANYTDQIMISGNKFRTNGGSDVGVYLSSTTAASGIGIQMLNNQINSTSPVFWSGSPTDPNVLIFNSPLGNTPVANLSFGQSGPIAVNSTSRFGSIYGVAGSSSSLLPTINSNGAGVAGDSNIALGSGTGKAGGTFGVCRATADASGDRCYGGWFKATASNNVSTEVGVHAESNDAGGTAAEFGSGGSAKVSISGTGAVDMSSGTGGLKIKDQGQCTMTTGTCSAQSLGHTYAAAPNCGATWNGSGTLTGLIKTPSTTTTVTPASTVGTDTAIVNWWCFGN